MNRDFSLKERVENTRDQQQIRCVVHFNLGTMSRKRTHKIDKF